MPSVSHKRLTIYVWPFQVPRLGCHDSSVAAGTAREKEKGWTLKLMQKTHLKNKIQSPVHFGVLPSLDILFGTINPGDCINILHQFENISFFVFFLLWGAALLGGSS